MMRVQGLIGAAGILIASILRAQSGDPERDAVDALQAAKALIDVDPAASLECSNRAAGRDPARQRWFWPLMLDAEIKLGRWEDGVRQGAQSVVEIEAGRMFGRARDVADEAKLRRTYGQALDHLGKIDEAGLQFSIAARLLGDKKIADARCDAIVAHEWAGRVAHEEDDLLAEQIDRAAPELHLKNLDGRAIELADFHGKAVVAIFWAIWCEPCVSELKSLNAAYPRLRDQAEILAIGVDDSTEKLRDFAKKNAYVFPIFESDRRAELPYTFGHIPQLYVIDRAGNIRFHLTGFDDDGLLEQRLGWMIQAVLR